MNTYAPDTSVPVEKSRAEIEAILARYGATRFGYMVTEHEAVIGFTMAGKFLRFTLPLPNPAGEEFTVRSYLRHGVKRIKGENPPEVAHKLWEQACRSKWRSLALCIKAKLEACSAGITTFEKEFLAHFVLPGGKTLGDRIIPQLEAMERTGKLPQLSLAGGIDI